MKALLLLFAILLPATVLADEFDRRLIHTNGYGEVKVKPDMARINLNVSATRKEASAAKKEVDDRVNAFIDKLLNLKIKKDDIVASSLRVNPQYEYNRAQSRQEFIGYQANRSMIVTVRNLDKLSDVMDLGLAEKIQGINNIQYDSSEEDKHRQQARLNAIENSKLKAKELANAYGAELGHIVRINYHSSHPEQTQFRPQAMEKMMVSANSDSAGGVYLPDELTYSDNIQVTFDLIIQD